MKKQTRKTISLKKPKSSKAPKSEYITVVKENLETPIVTLQFCALYKPYYFSGSHIPRYKVCVYLDPKQGTHKKYLESLEKYAVENDVATLGRQTDDGLILMSYQGRERPEIYLVEKGKKKAVPLDLEHDLPEGFKCKVKFDLRRYFDKFHKKNAFSFSPTKVTFYLDDETQKLVEVADGSSENSGD